MYGFMSRLDESRSRNINITEDIDNPGKSCHTNTVCTSDGESASIYDYYIHVMFFNCLFIVLTNKCMYSMDPLSVWNKV